MPYTTVKLVPGVNSVPTPSLNAAGIVDSERVRFQQGLVEKIGGWRQFVSSVGDVVWQMHAWLGMDGVARLAIGGGEGAISIFDGQTTRYVSPRNYESTVSPDFSTTLGSNVVTIVDAGSGVTIYDIVEVKTQVSVGGLIIHGLYNVKEVVSATSYKIEAATNATATVANGGDLPVFDTTAGSIVVTVTLADHGLVAGDTFAIPVGISIGGLVLSGFFRVQSAPSSSTFTIYAANKATTTDTGTLWAGSVRFVYWPSTLPPAVAGGYGMGPYGEGAYGVGSTSESQAGIGVSGYWSLDNFGGTLIACQRDGPIFSYAPDMNFGGCAIIKNAPPVNRGIVVSAQTRQIIAYGSSELGQQDPMLVRWCDVQDFDDWTASAINQAGKFSLSSGSKIMTALNIGLTTLILTDEAAWSMQYVGPDGGVFAFQKIPSTGCGAISQRCAVRLGTGVYWMGEEQFFSFRGTVQPIPCTVRDFVFDRINRDKTDRIFAGANSLFNEVCWFFTSTDSADLPDSYVKFNVVEGVWDKGSLERTAWLDKSIMGNPLSSNWSGFIYEHEEGHNDDDGPMASSFTTGWFTLADAQVYPFVDQVLPDFTFGADSGAVSITLRTTNEPGGAVREFGPYNVTPARRLIATRLRGRLVSMKVESTNIDTSWRIGAIRFRYAPDGRR